MSRRRSSYSGSYSGLSRRDKGRKVPSPLPYLIIAILAGAGLGYFHLFAFKSLSGTVSDSYTSSPLAGVPVVVTGGVSPLATPPAPPAVSITATTGPKGEFHFEKVPDLPVVSVVVDGFTAQTVEAAGKSSIEFKLVPNVLRGMVRTPDGNPVPGASVISGKTRVLAGADGRYEIRGMAEDRKLVIKAPGYLASSVEVAQVVTQDVTLQPFVAKAIYVSADSLATPGKLQALIDLVDRTELNALVIDVKADNSGDVLYASALPLVHELGTSSAFIPDLNGLLAQLKGKGIYTIARLSVFWDQALTRAKPEWALLSKKAPGQPWLSGNGSRWANPYMPEVWDYNIAIAKEVAQKGFDEVQFDFAYFPSVGELDDIEYGPQAVGKKRVDAINGFLERAYGELSPLGTYVGTNVLAFTPFVNDDMGIGTNLEMLGANTDYICPYLYPSDYPDGFADYTHPAEHPFDIVAGTMQPAVNRLANAGAKVRPWLQDFTIRNVTYDAAKVRAEIDAAEQNGAAGWMLWNFGNTYTEGALKGP
ncbi:MAG: putative glycoside hydrolase [Chloroflexia bacterium]